MQQLQTAQREQLTNDLSNSSVALDIPQTSLALNEPLPAQHPWTAQGSSEAHGVPAGWKQRRSVIDLSWHRLCVRSRHTAGSRQAAAAWPSAVAESSAPQQPPTKKGQTTRPHLTGTRGLTNRTATAKPPVHSTHTASRVAGMLCAPHTPDLSRQRSGLAACQPAQCVTGCRRECAHPRACK